MLVLMPAGDCLYTDTGEYDLAIANFTRVIDLDPENAVAYNSRGIAHDTTGEYDLALADYTEALRLDPDYTYAYNNRGITYYAQGEYELAN